RRVRGQPVPRRGVLRQPHGPGAHLHDGPQRQGPGGAPLPPHPGDGPGGGARPDCAGEAPHPRNRCLRSDGCHQACEGQGCGIPEAPGAVLVEQSQRGRDHLQPHRQAVRTHHGQPRQRQVLRKRHDHGGHGGGPSERACPSPLPELRVPRL
ncbi:hypothetical protein IWQ56_005731, partial [Coemansia nantahalensis]